MKILVAGGGTGGHLFPALAVAEEFKLKGWKVVFVGSQRGLETRIEDVFRYSPYFLPSHPLRGKNKLKGILSLGLSVLKALSITKKEKPNCTILFGGYSSLPAGIASILLGIPLFVQEQNSIPGKTSLYLSKFARKVFLGFESAMPYFGAKGIVTGNPLRREIIFCAKHKNQLRRRFCHELGLLPERKVLLVVGGSQGAKWLNETMIKAVNFFTRRDFQVVHISGFKKGEEKLKRAYKNAGIKAVVIPFFKEMWKLYTVADAVISRAGALAISEISAFSIPALFIPYPFAVDDHQYKNAKYFEEKKACVLITQEKATPVEVCRIAERLLLDVKFYKRISRNMEKLSKIDATEVMCNEVEKELGVKKPD
jgi:UDP-N-acetylglucosamine--N-acetylmuramyl-(pentapeptide) pyrophosphoryl-undecaprenol N-acetylglucosamine transferase